jgi:chromosome segregation ATPase
MRGGFCKKLRVLVPLALLGIFPLAAQQNSQRSQTGDQLADAARKARAEKKNEPKAKKVYTDDDFKTVTPPPAGTAQPSATPTEGASTAVSGTAAQTPGATKEDQNSEAAWRKRFADQRAKIAKAQEELDVLQRELNKNEVQYYSDPQKAMMQQYSRKDVNDKLAKIQQKKDELTKLQNQLSDMEDQLRKSGGDPGWARP